MKHQPERNTFPSMSKFSIIACMKTCPAMRLQVRQG